MNEKTRKARKAFAKKNLKIPVESTSECNLTTNVVITDESRFGLLDDSRSLWVQRGVYNERCFRPTPKHNTTVMVWGGIGWNYKSPLVFIDGTLNAERYQQMLERNGSLGDIKAHFPEHTVYFQQDGAPAHRAKSTVKKLGEQITVIIDWPANSPDLSVIENIWGILKYRIALRNPKNMAELKAMVVEEWDALTLETINGLFATVRERFRMCVEEKGRSIGPLVRNMAHTNETKPLPRPPRGLVCVRGIGSKHIGMTIQVRARVTCVNRDRQNRDLFWVQLEDLPEFTREGQTPRKIRMMTALTNFSWCQLDVIEWSWPKCSGLTDNSRLELPTIFAGH
jgi:hypothetical protein